MNFPQMTGTDDPYFQHGYFRPKYYLRREISKFWGVRKGLSMSM